MDWSSSYNARNSTPEQISQTFVRPRDFDRITNFQSKILVGPRGIGKTTIFKLLTPSGIHNVRKREEFRELSLDHIPLYIPADTLWKGEASSFEAMLADGSSPFSNSQLSHIQNALFVDYCLYETISSIQDAVEVAHTFYSSEPPPWCILINQEQEGMICQQLAEAWDLSSKPRSFIGLRLALLRRQNLYSSLVTSLSEPDLKAIAGLSTRSLFISLRAFFDIVQHHCGHQRWAVHFDEMEIAPRQILNLIYQSVRSFDSRAVIKFSLFPYIDFVARSGDGRTGPREGHDFEAVILSGRFKNEDYNFADSIAGTICSRRGIAHKDFVSYVNQAADRNSLDANTPSRTKRNYENIFSSLQSKDDSFRDYLRSKRIDISEIKKFTEEDRMPHVRKIAGIAEFRNNFLRSFKDGKSHHASRKAPRHYSNYSQILKLTEQNPRAISFYVEDIINGIMSRSSPESVVNDTIKKNVDRFRALIATQLVPYDPATNGAFVHALDVVDNLGRELSSDCLDSPFQPEPSLAFKISKNMDEYSLKIMGIAANSGAIILDSTQQQGLHLDLHNMRFRISYQLAPWYPIPTQLGNSRTISRLTFRRSNNQPSLFGWDDQ